MRAESDADARLRRKAEYSQALRKMLKKRYGVLYDQVTLVLGEADPIGMGLALDFNEYEPEAETILPRLTECSSVQELEVVIYEEFCNWFSEEQASEPRVREKFQPIAVKVWELWREFNKSQP